MACRRCGQKGKAAPRVTCTSCNKKYPERNMVSFGKTKICKFCHRKYNAAKKVLSDNNAN